MAAESKSADQPAGQGNAMRRRIDDAINQRLFETSLDLILVVSRGGEFLRVSPSALAILGYRPEEMVGHLGVDFVHADDLGPTRTEMREARLNNSTRNFDCRYMHKAGHPVPLNWTGVWLEEEAQHIFIGRDITEQLAAERKLQHAQRLEAVGQLTGGIAHDFNNLLAVVIGHLDLILKRPEAGATVTGFAEAALQAAQRGAELTRQLLAYARQQPLAPKVVDVNRLVGGMARLLGRTLEQNIDLRFLAGSGLWPVLIDPANLEAALANLVVNARDAMPEGGRLLIETMNATLDADYALANPGAEVGDYVALAVSDTGSGMAPEVLDRIFEPFFTTKEVGKGTGLGLSMVFGFVKQSGGYIKAYSEPGHGTTIRLYLPRAAGVPLPEDTVNAAPSAPRRARILAVEDNDAIRKLVLMQLDQLGYDATGAASAAEAVATLEASTVPFDLLFTDVVMPGGMNGVELARMAQQRQPGLRLLFTSGFPGALLADGREVASAEAVLGKPYRMQQLAAALAATLAK